MKIEYNKKNYSHRNQKKKLNFVLIMQLNYAVYAQQEWSGMLNFLYSVWCSTKYVYAIWPFRNVIGIPTQYSCWIYFIFFMQFHIQFK